MRTSSEGYHGKCSVRDNANKAYFGLPFAEKWRAFCYISWYKIMISAFACKVIVIPTPELCKKKIIVYITLRGTRFDRTFDLPLYRDRVQSEGKSESKV
jgi:hypothetical protein